MMRFAIFAAAATALAACGGGDLCSSDVSTVAGTWDVVLDAEGDKMSATVIIDESGNVSLTTSEGDGWKCDSVDDSLCALKVHCVQGNDEFTLSLTRK